MLAKELKETDENVIRKNFVPSEAVAVWLSLPTTKWGQSRSNFERKIEDAAKRTGYSTYTFGTTGKKLPLSESDIGHRRKRAAKRT